MRLSVEGYKSIATKGSIDVVGLTIIAGANSSGKSSFMQPFLILKQTVENNTDGEALIISGENVNLTEKNQLICKKSENSEFSIYVERSDKKSNKEEVKTTFTYIPEKGFISKCTTINNSKINITISYDMKNSEIDAIVNELKSKDKIFKEIYNNFKSDKFTLVHSIKNTKPFLSIDVTPKPKRESKREIELGMGFGFNPNGIIEKIVDNLIHIPGIRSNPERQYKLEWFNEKFQGRFDKYTATVIYKWMQHEKSKLEDLNKLIKYLDLASNVSAKKINEVQIAIEVSRSLNSDINDSVNLSDVGFGLSQVLPILVALIESNKNNIIYIEQPEIHLHPKAQFKLAKIFCDYVKKGKKIIVETHSSIFIRGLQIEVAEKKLSSSLFSLNWFIQDENGDTSISQATFDDCGTFGEWPSDFDDVYLTAESKYLDAVEQNLYND